MEKAAKVIVFDWDGTLFDSMDNKTRNMGLVFHHHFDFSEKEVVALYCRYSGIPRRELFAQILADLGGGRILEEDVFQNLSQEFTRLNQEANRGAKLFPDVKPCLDLLCHSGRSLYISSSSPAEELRPLTEQTEITSYFRAVFGSTPEFNKGEEHWREVCRLEKCTLNELLFVGDDEQDAVLAERNNVRHLRIVRSIVRDENNLYKNSMIHSLLDLCDA